MWYSRNKESEYENLDSEGEAEAAALAKQNVRSESEQREIDEFEEEERKILSQDSQKEVSYYKDTYVCWFSELLGRFVADFMKKDMTKIRDIRSIKEKKRHPTRIRTSDLYNWSRKFKIVQIIILGTTLLLTKEKN